MYKYNKGERFEVTKDIMIPFSPFSHYRVLKGAKGTISNDKGAGSYSIELDNKDAMTISKSLLDTWSELIDYDYSKLEPIPNKPLVTVENTEDRILRMTANIWSQFKTLEQTHPSDMEDLADAIHNIQKIVAIRIARRYKSDKFVTYKK